MSSISSPIDWASDPSCHEETTFSSDEAFSALPLKEPCRSPETCRISLLNEFQHYLDAITPNLIHLHNALEQSVSPYFVPAPTIVPPLHVQLFQQLRSSRSQFANLCPNCHRSGQGFYYAKSSFQHAAAKITQNDFLPSPDMDYVLDPKSGQMSLISPPDMLTFLRLPLFCSYMLFQVNQRTSLFLRSEKNKVATLIARTKSLVQERSDTNSNLSMYIPWLCTLYENVYEFWIFCIYQRRLAELFFSSSHPPEVQSLLADSILSRSPTPPSSPTTLKRQSSFVALSLVTALFGVLDSPSRELGPLRLYNANPDTDY